MLKADALGIFVKETVIQQFKNELEIGQEVKYEAAEKSFEEALPPKEEMKPKTVGEAKIKASNFVQSHTGKLRDVYRIGKLLGSGRLGEIRLCVHR